MPQYTLGELMSMATTECGRRADIPPSEVSSRVNRAYFDVANALEPSLQERFGVSSTTSGENRIDLPTDFAEPISVSLIWSWSTSSSAVSSTRTLARVSASHIDANGVYPVGEPYGYCFFANWMELIPSPDSAYSVNFRYRSMVTDMLATGDIPSVSTPAREAILLKAKEFIWEYLGDRNASAMAEQKYLGYMARLKTDEYRRQMGESPMGMAPVYRDVSRGYSGSRISW
jgi:hypothetical protein